VFSLKTAISWWRILKWVILTIVLAGLGFYILSHLDDFKILADINPTVILWLVLISIFSQIVMAVRSHAVMEFLGLDISIIRWIRVLIVARFLNRFIPQSGNIYRATVLKMEHGFLIRNYISAYTVFIILWWLCSICYTTIAVMVLEPGLTVSGYPIAPILFLLIAVLIVGFYIVGLLSSSVQHLVRRWGRWPVIMNEVIQTMITCLKNVRLIASIAVWGILTFALVVASNWICFASLGTFPGIARITVYSSISATFTFFSVTPGNIGVVEGIYGLISSGMEELAAVGIIVALMLRVTGFISLLLLAAIFGGSDIIKRFRIRR
jgi:uncharacterized membrane protein YbhN (UPF0104 family)